MPVRGLTVTLCDPDPRRLRGALNLACAAMALGGRGRLFLDAGAVALMAAPLRGEDDDVYQAAGLPSLRQLLEEALGLGLELILCQSGLQLTGLTMESLDPRLHAGGLVSLLETLGEDRLLAA